MSGRRLSLKSSLICVAIVAIVLVAYAAWSCLGAKPGAYAVVHDGDGGETTLSLSQNQTTTISTSLGTNVVVVEDGQIYVSEADCPNHDCMQQGKISEPGQQIICLPHKLWVEVFSEDGTASGSGSQFDAISR